MRSTAIFLIGDGLILLVYSQEQPDSWLYDSSGNNKRCCCFIPLSVMSYETLVCFRSIEDLFLSDDWTKCLVFSTFQFSRNYTRSLYYTPHVRDEKVSKIITTCHSLNFPFPFKIVTQNHFFPQCSNNTVIGVLPMDNYKIEGWRLQQTLSSHVVLVVSLLWNGLAGPLYGNSKRNLFPELFVFSVILQMTYLNL